MILQTTDDVHLFYETYGDSHHPALLLLHGLGADHQMWRPQIARYPSEGFFAIAPDMRGHGSSSVPDSFALGDCARDMAELLGALGVARATIAGVSMGGLIAQQMACDYPELMDRLVVADSFSGTSTALERFNGWLASVLLTLLPSSLQTKLLVSTYTKMGKPQVAAYFEAQAGSIENARLRQMRRAVNKFDILDRLGEIACPTLVLVGDGFGQMAVNMARTTAEAIPDSAFKVLEGGGDPSNLLVPDAFDREVLGFIKES
jgi:3-oxoadipate enol-lactonase